MAIRNMALDVIVRLKDLLSGPLRGVRSALEGVAGMARKIGLVGAAVAGISFLGPMQGAAAFQQQLLDIAGTSNLAGQAAFAYVEKAKAQFEGLALQYGQFSDTIAQGASKMIAAGLDEALVDRSMAPILKASKAANASVDDMSGVAISLLQTLKLPADELEDTLAALAIAGKLGSFELKDMARFFPGLTGQMAKLGITGRDAANQLASMLEIARKGTADPAEAANNLNNFLSKITAPETRKNFEKMGVDIVGVMQNAATKGISPVEAAIQKISKLTKVSGAEIAGLMKQARANGMTEADALEEVRKKLEAIHGAGALGGLFADMQVMGFLIPMLANIDEYKQIKAEVAKATGAMTDADFETQMRSLNTQLITFRELGEQAVNEVGLAFGAWMPLINGYLTDAIAWLRALDRETGGMVRSTLSWAGAALMATAALGALGLALPVVSAGASALASPFLLLARLALPALSLLGGVLSGIGAVIAGVTAPVWLLVAAIAAVGVAVYKYWEPISNFIGGFASVVGPALGDVFAAFSQFHAGVRAWAGQKLIDLALWLGFDPASVDGVIASAGKLLEWISGVPAKIGSFLANPFDYSDEAEASFRSAGERWGLAMVEAIKGAFGALLDWFKGLPAAIRAAIGSIDLSSLISWPSPPSWLPGWMGGGGGERPAPASGLMPANSNGAPAVLPAQAGGGGPQQLDVNSQMTVRVEGPGQVVNQSTDVTSPSPNINTGRAVGRP